MIEVYKNLYVGNEQDYEQKVKGNEGWAVVHTCKEPYHRQILGYTGRGAPKDHPEYLFAERDNRLALNIVDADNPEFFDKSMIDYAMCFIFDKLEKNLKVLIHCNQGESRSPSIAMLYIAIYGRIPNNTIEDAEKAFIQVYPKYNPKQGIRGHMGKFWNEYIGR